MTKTKTKSPELTPTELILADLVDSKTPKKLPEELSGVMSISEQIAGTTKKASEQVATHKTKVELEKFKTIASAGDNFPVSPENPFEGFEIGEGRQMQFKDFPEEQKNWVLNIFNKAKEAGLQNKDIEKVTKSAVDYMYGYIQYVAFFEGKIDQVSSKSIEYALKIIKSKLPDLVSDKAIKQAKDFFETRKEFKMKQIAELEKESAEARKESAEARKESAEARKESAEARKESAEARKESAEARKLIKALRELNELLKQNQ